MMMENYSQATPNELTNNSVGNSNNFTTLSNMKNNSVINPSIMFSVGVFSNILALVVLRRTDGHHKRKLFYRLVAGLTVTDLLGTISVSPVVIAVYANNVKWIGGEALCQYFAYMMVFSGNSTMTIVCLMSVERLLCIRHPYLYFTKLRKRHATFFLIGAWLFSGLIASLPVVGFGSYVRQYPGTWCFLDYFTENATNVGFNCLFALFALSTITTTVVCNVVVLCSLLKSKFPGYSFNQNENSRMFAGTARRYAECQMVVLLIGITVVFSFCYLPLMIRILINQTRLYPVNYRMDFVVIYLASLNQILDPWVYILLRREIVSRIVGAVRSLFGRDATTCKQRSTTDGQNTQPLCFLSDPDDQSFCSFCCHCMCDPPAPSYRERSLWLLQSQRSLQTNRGSLIPPIDNIATRSAQTNLLSTVILSNPETRGNINDINFVTSQPNGHCSDGNIAL